MAGTPTSHKEPRPRLLKLPLPSPLSDRKVLIYLKMANEEDVLVDLSENVIEDKSTPKRKGNKVRTRRWTDEETDILIDMFEESACLWDIFSKDYHMKDKRDKAYEKIQEELDIPIATDYRDKEQDNWPAFAA